MTIAVDWDVKHKTKKSVFHLFMKHFDRCPGHGDRALDQALIIFNCVPFHNGNFS